MFLIKSADTALCCPTAIGCRLFYAGPLNAASTSPFFLVSNVIFTQRFSGKHIWKCARSAADAF